MYYRFLIIIVYYSLVPFVLHKGPMYKHINQTSPDDIRKKNPSLWLFDNLIYSLHPYEEEESGNFKSLWFCGTILCSCSLLPVVYCRAEYSFSSPTCCDLLFPEIVFLYIHIIFNHFLSLYLIFVHKVASRIKKKRLPLGYFFNKKYLDFRKWL